MAICHSSGIKETENYSLGFGFGEFWGISGNFREFRGRDGELNSNHRGMGRGKTAGDLGERIPRVPHGIPNYGHPERAFFQKFETFELGQTNWAEKF